MKNILFTISLFLTFQIGFAQEKKFAEQEITIDKFTDGTLILTDTLENMPLVIFIQGSGPVDRNGNIPMAKNDGIKKIAHQLAEEGIASFRYDKRIFKMDKLGITEEDLRFGDFVTDANSVIDYFKNDERFENIIVAGHSEGSLIGILAVREKDIDGFISLAGPARPIDEIIIEQLAKQSAELSANARSAFDEIKTNGQTTNYSPYLESIFRPSVQPYISSWMAFNPSEEIAKLDVPVLIVNGSFDLQVDVMDAELLKKANPEAELVILENMNHIFRKIEGENLENTKAYNEPGRELHPELIPVLVEFIKSID